MKNWGIMVKYRSAHTYIVLRLITKNYYYAGFASESYISIKLLNSHTSTVILLVDSGNTYSCS